MTLKIEYQDGQEITVFTANWSPDATPPTAAKQWKKLAADIKRGFRLKRSAKVIAIHWPRTAYRRHVIPE